MFFINKFLRNDWADGADVFFLGFTQSFNNQVNLLGGEYS